MAASLDISDGKQNPLLMENIVEEQFLFGIGMVLIGIDINNSGMFSYIPLINVVQLDLRYCKWRNISSVVIVCCR